MRRLTALLVVACVLTGLLASPASAQQKLAQTGMKFLNVISDARSTALGEAYTAVDGGAASLYYNPAGIARITQTANIVVGQTQWIADIKHNVGSIAISPFNGEYGVIGLFLQGVDYGTLYQTVRSNNDKGYLDLGTFNPTGTMIGVAYARALSDKFSVGGAVKYVHQDLGPSATVGDSTGPKNSVSSNTSAYAFDFGLIYRTGFKSLAFGMAVRNFSREVQFQSEGFQLPLTFKIGVSMNLTDVIPIDPKMHNIFVTVDAEHPRDYREQIKFGIEYTFLKEISLRVGYVNPADQHSWSYGAGIQQNFDTVLFAFDYAYTPFGDLGNVHRVTFQFGL